MPSAAPTVPRVWLLLGDKGGDNAQLRVLAAALGWPTEEKLLSYGPFYRIPNVVRGASLASLRTGRETITEPWPDVILASGRRAVPVARWIKAQSGGRTRLVHVGRAWAPLSWFDLIVAMPQYRVPAAPNVFQALLPLNRMPPELLARRAAEWRTQLTNLAGPYVAVLLGGPARPLRFTATEAELVAAAADEIATRLKGAVLAIGSRRTPPAVIAAFRSRLRSPALVHDWRPGDTSNAYQGFLGLAEHIVVSGDSASMLAEACRTAKPVTVVPLPHDPAIRARLDRTIDATLPAAMMEALQRNGIAVAARDMRGLVRSLAQRSHITLPGNTDARTQPVPDDLPRIAARIRELVSA